MNYLWYLAGAVFLALSVADLLQTINLQKLGAVENNPLLGKHPAPGKLIAFAVVSTALWLVAALFLASKGAPGIAAVFALGIGLRIRTVVKGWKLQRELRASSTSTGGV